MPAACDTACGLQAQFTSNVISYKAFWGLGQNMCKSSATVPSSIKFAIGCCCFRCLPLLPQVFCQASLSLSRMPGMHIEKFQQILFLNSCNVWCKSLECFSAPLAWAPGSSMLQSAVFLLCRLCLLFLRGIIHGRRLILGSRWCGLCSLVRSG